ncbi:MAG: hypothetical protein IKS00_03265 [Bacteroidales bacterium]|nr:hypothetical protein [Bacteroidales bacterium]
MQIPLRYISSRFKVLIITIVLWLCPMCMYAQIHSLIRHYGRSSGIAGQTWNICAADNNFVFLANGENMLSCRNGIFTPQQFKTEVRSVYSPAKSARIYIGGINELGYFTVLDDGSLSYTSLSDSLELEQKNSLGNVWHIYGIDQNVYYVSDNLIVKYNGARTEVFNPHAHIDCASVVDGVLYVSSQGVKYLHGNALKVMPNTEPISQLALHGFASFNGGILAVSENNGLFFCDGNICEPFETKADTFLQNSSVFCIADNNDELAIGTIKGGIVVVNKNTRTAEIISEAQGLENNTVISLSYQDGKSLWAGLDNSVDEILLHSGLKKFLPKGLEGAGYDAAIDKNTLYLATNRGAFFTQLPLNNTQLNTIEGLTGQAWKFYKAFETIFCLHDKGLFVLDNGKAKNISGIKGFWGMVQISDTVALAATYSEFYIVKKRGSDYVFKLQELIGSFSNMVFDGTNVWLHSDNADSCARGSYNYAENQVDIVKYYRCSDGLPDDKNFRLNFYNGSIYAVSSKATAVYNSSKDIFEKTDSICGLDTKEGFAAVSQFGNSAAGLSQNCLELTCGKKSHDFYFDADFIYPSSKANAPFFINDSLLLVPNYNGFALVCLSSCTEAETVNNSVINSVYLADGTPIWKSNVAGLKYVPEIPYEQANLKFNFADHNRSALYQYRLGSDDFSSPASTYIKEFTSLPEGEYTFQVRKTESNGRVLGEDSFKFVILAPWYRTTWAYAAYMLIAIALVFAAVKILTRSVAKQKQQIIDKAQEDMQQLERQLVQQQLQNDLEHKTNELSNMALLLAGKNEILGSLKNDISEIYKEPKLPPLLKAKLAGLSSKIDANIQNDNLIDRFEEQFDLLHNNFIKKLRQLHPGLSRNDYMLCAYIRMGFSTKEIAQMLNMSVRGVESIKYRFKKKINIDTDISEYLKQVESEK